MWRLSLLALIILPPVAVVLNHSVVSAVLIIAWTMIVVPLCLLHAVDSLRSHKPRSLARAILQVLVALLGLTCVAMGSAIVIWCLYNVLVRRLPEYSGPTGALSLAMEAFGVAPALISFGLRCLRQAAVH